MKTQLPHMIDWSLSSLFIGVCSGASSFASISAAAVEILGVPLPVVLAAIAGAFIARSYAPSGNFFASAAATIGWAVAGCVLAPLASWLLKVATGVEAPANVQAGLALLVSAFLPIALPIVREKLPEIIKHWLDRAKGGGNSKGGQ